MSTSPDLLVLTGFGPFSGVPVNPTTTLVEELPSPLRGDLPASCTLLPLVLPVSESGVTSSLKNSVLPCLSSHKHVTFVHLGVDMKRLSPALYRLESTCYNERSYRVPDEEGNQPVRQPVLQSSKSSLVTDLPVDKLRDILKRKGHETVVSRDPGRFLCNYVYYLTSELCSRYNATNTVCPPGGLEWSPEDDKGDAAERKKWSSLFVHLPPFDFVNQEDQIEFVRELCKLIASGCEEDSDGDGDGIVHSPSECVFSLGPNRVEYTLSSSVVDIYHTYTDPGSRGKGIAGKIVKKTLEYARSNGFKVRPTCSYVKHYIEKRSEEKDLLE